MSSDWAKKYFWSTDVKENIKDGKLTIPSGKTGIEDCACIDLEELREVEIPEGVTFIASSAFAHCPNLEKVTFPDSLREIYEGAFNDCPSLKSVEIPAGCKYNGAAFDHGIKDGRWGYLVDITERQPEKIPTKAAEPDKTIDTLAEKLLQQPESKSGSLNASDKAVVQMKDSSIKPLPNHPGRSYASIGLNSEHGTYGNIYFSDKSLKTPRSNPDVRLLYLNPDKEYNVAFSNPDTDKWEYHNMTGREISDGNRAYLKERGLVKDAVTERPLPDIADSMESLQSDTEYE